MPDISTNATLTAAGYTTAPRSSYGLKLILRDGEPGGHYDCQSAWDLPGMREVREAPVTDFDRTLSALAGPTALATSRKLDDRLDLLNASASSPCARASASVRTSTASRST